METLKLNQKYLANIGLFLDENGESGRGIQSWLINVFLVLFIILITWLPGFNFLLTCDKVEEFVYALLQITCFISVNFSYAFVIFEKKKITGIYSKIHAIRTKRRSFFICNFVSLILIAPSIISFVRQMRKINFEMYLRNWNEKLH